MENQSHSRVGRPAAFAPERAAKAIEAVRAGHTRKVAAQAAGVSEATLYRWLDTGERHDAPDEFREFCECMRAAESQAERDLVDVVLAEAKGGSWRAASWLLERRHRDNWAAKSKVEIESTQANNQARDVQSTIDEANAAAAEIMRVPEFIGRPLDQWPPSVRAAAGF